MIDACYDRGIPFFGENGFLMPGLLNLLILSSEIEHFCFWHGSRCVPRLCDCDFSSGSFIYFFPISFWERSYAPKLRGSITKKKRGAPLS